MSEKDLSPDAQLIMAMLRKLVNHIDYYEKTHILRKMYIGKKQLKYFISLLEEKLGIK